MICFKCGSELPSGSKFCSQCRCPIPSFPSHMEVRPATSLLCYLRSLKEQILGESIPAGKIGESFEKVLQHMEGSRSTFIGQSTTMPDELLAGSRYEETVAAMEEFAEAVREMALYCEDNDPAHLTCGLEAAEVADIQLQDALQQDDTERISLSTHTTFVLPP